MKFKERSTMNETHSAAPQTLDGWFALHDFRTFDWRSWKQLSPSDRQDILSELFDWQQEQQIQQDAHLAGFGAFSIVGHKADFMWLHFRRAVHELVDVKHSLNQIRFGDYLQSPYSYFSVVELGGYLSKPGTDPLADPELKARLQPSVPGLEHVCFYPMNKKRQGNDNWYTLQGDERREYLKAHGMIGRTYAGRVKQIITGSMGLDDWEWGVTLFAEDALQFKKLVYEMRFDEGSARFGEFGPFLVGHRLTQDHWMTLLNPR
jgi:peroxiredoxin